MSAVLLEHVGQLEQALGLAYRLGDEQRAVVTAPLDSALVVAGAGSGKTETMSLRVAWLVGTGQVRADEVLGLTFTRKAAGELAERVTRAVERMQAWAAAGPGASGQPGLPSVLQERPQARTYHSFAADLVQTHAARLHLDEVRLLGAAAAHQLVDRVVREWAHPLDIGMEPRAVATAVLELAGECAEHRVGTERLADVLDSHLELLAEQQEAGLLVTAPPARGAGVVAPPPRAGAPARGLHGPQARGRTARPRRPGPPGRRGGRLPGGRRGAARRAPGGLPRRVPGHLGRADRPARRAVR
jgi:DNA helicase-2/ATP-dependent DNA helicase PcrA